MTVIALWRCLDCGWTRDGKYGGKCRNAFAHESVDAPKVERVEYVPAGQLRDAMRALQEYGRHRSGCSGGIHGDTISCACGLSDAIAVAGGQ